MRTKILKTLGIAILVFYAACILIFQIGSVLWLVYLSLLVAAFFWSKKDLAIPLYLAAALPIAEFIWMLIRSDFGQTRLLENLKNYSAFFEYGGFPGYIMWIVVVPYAVYKLYPIWVKE